ncbi:MAG: DUF2130 domain-containing protein [Tepidisphaeraceae bacterium]
MTDAGQIRCPKCTHTFAVNDALRQSIEQNLRADYEARLAAQQATLDAQKQKLADDLKLVQQEKASVEALVKQKLEAERKQIITDEQRKAGESVKVLIDQLKSQLNDSKQRLEQSQKSELELRLKQEEVEQAKKEIALQIARAKDEARELAAKAKDEEFRLKEIEWQIRLEQMKKQAEEMKLKAEQGSQQLQGEALELDLQRSLEANFLTDEIVEVKKGIRGGDVLQNVRNDQQLACGSILWEFKNVKLWQKEYIDKARADCLAAKAQAAVIVTTAPPVKPFDGLTRIQDVWIVSPQLIVPLAMAIRQSLIGAAGIRRSYEGKHDKMSELYDYVVGDEFASRIKHIVDTFVFLKKQIDDERRVFEKQWATREKQIEMIVKNTTALVGHITAIGGREMEALDILGTKALIGSDS